MDPDKIVDRYQGLRDQGYSEKDALLIVAAETVHIPFAFKRDFHHTRLMIQTHAEGLLAHLLEDPDLKVMRDQTHPTEPWHLAWMLDTVQSHVFKWPLDKLGRWMGFVQGVLVEQRKLSVEHERNRTRSAYQVAYAMDGLEVPETV